MGSSPARRPRSCSPPTSSGSNRLPRRTTSAPAPGTPPSLWALTLTRSASSAPRSVGTWPQAAAASTCTVTPASRQSSTTSCTGWRVPTSWLPHWQCTSAGRGRPRRPQALPDGVDVEPTRRVHADLLGRRGPRPRRRGRRSARRRRRARARPGAARVAPQTAALIASVPPEVKTTWRRDHAEQVGHLRPRRLERVADGAALLVEPAGVARRERGPASPARRGPRAAAVSCWRGRGRREPRGAQAEAVQASSPRARDERITGSAWCDAVPHSSGQQPLDHAAVDRAQHRVGAAGVAEGALLGDDRRGVAPVLGVGGEAVGGQRLGHHVHGGPHGALTLARGHARRQGAPVLLADVRRHLPPPPRARAAASPRRADA